MKRIKTLGIIGILFVMEICMAGKKDVSPEARMLQAYVGGQYALAKRLSRKCPVSDKTQLILALCDVYNLKDQDLKNGLSILKRLYTSSGTAKPIRCQAGLNYARVAQTLAMRNGLYREVKGIDYEEIYLDIIKSYPESSSAVLAAMYLTQEWFESNAPSKIAEAFKLLNEFIINYKGNKQFLAPLHYMLSDQYIIHGKQYRTAVKELELAVKTGLSNPRVCEDARYRIARIYDTRLHNRTKALNSYNEFIKIYPASSRSVLAKRYVSELKNGNKR